VGLALASLCAASPAAAASITAAAKDSLPSKESRPSFTTSFYFGLGIDSFAASDLNKYLNPDESSDKKERGVGGFDFAYRLKGVEGHARQLWIYGETVHGVRSADLDLTGLDSLASFRLTGYADPGSRTLYILRNATSLEAFVGLRLELMQLAKDQESAVSSVYLFGEYGFLTVSGSGQDVLDQSFYGAGVGCVGGKLSGSRLQAGIGRSDFFGDLHHMTRFKVDGELNWTSEAMQARGMSMFSQLTVDSDVGPGSDSVQSYLGFSFELKNFLQIGGR
jgi:hypothetical protein